MTASSDGLRTAQSSPDRRLWLWWALCSVGAQSVWGGLLFLLPFLAVSISEVLPSLDLDLGAIPAIIGQIIGIIGWALGGLIQGLVVGFVQRWVLRRRVPYKSWGAWGLATAIGTLLAATPAFLIVYLHTLPLFEKMLIAMLTTYTPAPLEIKTALSVSFVFSWIAWLGTVSGPILGLAQWWVLRDNARKAGWWILVHTGAWLLITAVALVAGTSEPGRPYISENWALVAGMGVIPLAYAAQGLVLARLLRQRPIEQP